MQFIDITEDTKPKSKKKNSADVPIAKDTNLGELAAAYPHLAEVLQEDYGLHCVGCFASSFDTLEMGAVVHGLSDTDIDEMVERLKDIHSRTQKTQKAKKHTNYKA